MFETYPLYHSIASYFHSASTSHYTTLPHFFHHLLRLHHLSSHVYALAPCIKPIAYRSLRFIPGHQSCHYDTDINALHFNDYVPHATTNIFPASTKPNTFLASTKYHTFPNSTMIDTFPNSTMTNTFPNSKTTNTFPTRLRLIPSPTRLRLTPSSLRLIQFRIKISK